MEKRTITVWVVWYMDDGKSPEIQVFEDRGAAALLVQILLGKYDRVGIKRETVAVSDALDELIRKLGKEKDAEPGHAEDDEPEDDMPEDNVPGAKEPKEEEPWKEDKWNGFVGGGLPGLPVLLKDKLGRVARGIEWCQRDPVLTLGECYTMADECPYIACGEDDEDSCTNELFNDIKFLLRNAYGNAANGGCTDCKKKGLL